LHPTGATVVFGVGVDIDVGTDVAVTGANCPSVTGLTLGEVAFRAGTDL